MDSLMRKEIAEQPRALTATLEGLLPLQSEIRALFADRRHVLFFARGTSDAAAVYGQYLMPTHAGRLAGLGSASVATLYRAEVNLDDVVAVGLSQSGGTEEITQSLEWARNHGARTVAITNVADSPLAASADLALITQAGVERAVPATKTYTAQLAALAVLAGSVGDDEALLAGLRRTPESVAELLELADRAGDLAAELRQTPAIVVSGRGYASSTALELALKLQETSYVSAIGMSYADLLHGPIAMVDSKTAVVLVASQADTAVLPGIIEVARRCRREGATIVGLGGDAAFRELCHLHLPGPGIEAPLAPIPLIVPGQLLAEALARAKGLSPDAPRGLSKVTQT